MFDVNLVAPARAGRAGVSLVATAAVPVALMLVGVAVWMYVLNQQVNGLRHQLTRATEQIAVLRPVARHAQTLQQDAQQMHRRRDLLQQLLGTQMPASRILGTIRSIVPHDMSLTGVTAGASEVTFEGYTLSYPSIARFMVALEDSRIVHRVTLTSSHRENLFGSDVVKFRVAGNLAVARPTTAPSASAP
jgi:Tfp pilus assembly protein PilN